MLQTGHIKNAMLGKIVLSLLGTTAVAALATLALTVHATINEYRDYYRSRLVQSSVVRVSEQGEAGAGRPSPSSGFATGQMEPFPVFSQTVRDQLSDSQSPTCAAEKMFPDSLTKDFGTVPQESQLFHRFPITNIYAVPVEIACVRPTCGCVTAEAGTRILQPHQRTTIDVRMDARRFTGRETVAVRVKVVGPDFESACKLVVSAVRQADVVLKPSRAALSVAPDVLSLGTVNAGEPLLRRVLVRANRPFRVTNVEGLGGGITLGVAPLDTPATVQIVTFRCLFTDVGDFEKKLQIKTDLPEAPPTVTIHGTVATEK